MTVAINYTDIGNAAAAAEDQTKMKEGGSFERPVPVAGQCILRLQQYIEIGKHKPKNPQHKPAERAMLRFELHTPKHLIEIETEEGTKKIPGIIDIELNKGGKTSRYGRLFAALNYNGKYNHFAQMVGAGSWKAEVIHNIQNKGEDNEKTYANLDNNGAWTFAAPEVVDPVAETVTPIAVPELDGDPKLFLWENKGISDAAYIALWKTLFIEGEWEAKGDKPAKSKNWIQNKIKDSLTFPDSRLAKLLADNPEGVDIVEAIEQGEQSAQTTTEQAAEAAPVQTEAPTSTEGDVDPLLELL